MVAHMLTNLEIFLRNGNLINLQCIRWRRKPRWLPVAKSKMFTIPPRTVTPESERIELMRLYNNYNTQMKTIRSYLHSEHNIKSVIHDTEEHHKQFMDEFRTSLKLNDIWNKKQLELGKQRHLQQLDLTKQTVYENIDKRNEFRKRLSDTIEELVRIEKKAAAAFISLENLDTVIESAITNPVDYNFATDLEGNLIPGRHTGQKETK